MARRVRLILQTFKFTIYSIIVHYKHRVPPPPTCTNWGGAKIFFAREFTIYFVPPIMELVAPPLVLEAGLAEGP